MTTLVNFSGWMSTPFENDCSEILIHIGTGSILIRPQGIVVSGADVPPWCFVPSVVKNINTTLKEMHEYLKPYLGVDLGKIYDAEDLRITSIISGVVTKIHTVGDILGVLPDHRSGLLIGVPAELVMT